MKHGRFVVEPVPILDGDVAMFNVEFREDAIFSFPFERRKSAIIFSSLEEQDAVMRCERLNASLAI